MYMFAVFAGFPCGENPQNRSLVGIPQPPGNAPKAYPTKLCFAGTPEGRLRVLRTLNNTAAEKGAQAHKKLHVTNLHHMELFVFPVRLA